MERFVGIGEAAVALGVSITTLRRWEAEGRLVAEHTPGGHRRYNLAKLRPEQFRATSDAARKTIAYARVSSHDQKDDLERQKQVLELYCARQGRTCSTTLRCSTIRYESMSETGCCRPSSSSGSKKSSSRVSTILGAIQDRKYKYPISHVVSDRKLPNHSGAKNGTDAHRRSAVAPKCFD